MTLLPYVFALEYRMHVDVLSYFDLQDASLCITPLLDVVGRGTGAADMIKLLLTNGADVNARDHQVS